MESHESHVPNHQTAHNEEAFMGGLQNTLLKKALSALSICRKKMALNRTGSRIEMVRLPFPYHDTSNGPQHSY